MTNRARSWDRKFYAEQAQLQRKRDRQRQAPSQGQQGHSPTPAPAPIRPGLPAQPKPKD